MLYCEYCGEEIHIVPEFEPEADLDPEVSSNLSAAVQELNPDGTDEDPTGDLDDTGFPGDTGLLTTMTSGRKWIPVALAVMVLAIAGTILWGLIARPSISAADAVEAAQHQIQEGNLSGAIENLEMAYELDPKDSKTILTLSECYAKSGDTQKAAKTLDRIINSAAFEEAEVSRAYQKLIEIYEQNQDYEKLGELLGQTENPQLQAAYSKYQPADPYFSELSGTFDDELTVEIQSNTPGTIYYTVNGTTPDQKSETYSQPLLFDVTGDYHVEAVLVNFYGLSSKVVSADYHVEVSAPEAPQILEASGTYTRATKIVAVTQIGNAIFYTTDGTDPTMESQQYVSPINMPFGDSQFRFASFDGNGRSSEVVVRTYHLGFEEKVMTKEAVDALVQKLVSKGLLLDTECHVEGKAGRNSYAVEGNVTFPQNGAYYSITEYYIGTDGTPVKTGLLFAVNKTDGSVKRLLYDSTGHAFLKEISGLK